jgi:hypothetical protein
VTTQGPSQPNFSLIWFSGFRGEDLNVIFYQNMYNLYNQYKSVERKISKTWQGWSLGSPISNICPTAPPSIQDGCCY